MRPVIGSLVPIARLRQTGNNGQLRPAELGDFTATPRLVAISGLALGIGFVAALVAWALLRLIGLCTNLFFHLRWGTDIVPITHHDLGPAIIVVPVVGGLVIGTAAGGAVCSWPAQDLHPASHTERFFVEP